VDTLTNIVVLYENLVSDIFIENVKQDDDHGNICSRLILWKWSVTTKHAKFMCRNIKAFL